MKDDSQLWQEVEEEFVVDAASSPFGEEHDKYKQLALLLQNELAAPDLLPSRLFHELKERIDGIKSELFDKQDALERAILEMDLKRWEYELVSLNRARIQKLAKYPSYFLDHQESRMSLVEREFAEEFRTLRNGYMNSVLLAHLPVQLQQLEQQPMPNGQVQHQLYAQPEMHKFVMFRALRDLPDQVFATSGDSTVTANSSWSCPYSEIRDHVANGDALLL
ncbi:hypothetical protein BASA81_004479 [Batrachochytrium salamandrivorans]|nr:hypothetical protein BASA81_004479 [Batrachochytrium salamandrivorans]